MVLCPSFDPDWCLKQTDANLLAWLVAIGENRGGKFDFKKKTWVKQPQPEAVYAIMSSVKEN